MDVKNELIKSGLIKRGKFDLKSGISSDIYFDFRELVSYPKMLKEISRILGKKILEEKPDLIVGLAYGSIPLAVACSIETDIPAVFIRKESKGYGLDKRVEGHYKAGMNCIVLDDVITDGGSKVDAVNVLKSAGLKIKQILVLVDRQDVKTDRFKKLNINLKSLWVRSDFD